MNKQELFDFMIDIVCLSDNSDKLRFLKTMTFGEFHFNLKVKSDTWDKFCKKKCYPKHYQLFRITYYMINYNHNFPIEMWDNFTEELNKVKSK